MLITTSTGEKIAIITINNNNTVLAYLVVMGGGAYEIHQWTNE